MGKRLTTEDKLEVLKLLKSGFTSKICAQKMGVSAPTINNLRAQFKKEGEVFPNNRGRKKLPKRNHQLSANIRSKEFKPYQSDNYEYLIDGVEIRFNLKPKTILIGKNRFFVEFD